MNETTIENILFHAPRPVAPAGLLNRLQGEIALPAKKWTPESRPMQNPLRRWFPALAFGMVMLSCALLFAVQSNWSTNLKRQNEALRAATADLPQLREQHAALDAAQAEHDELVQLRKDNQEMQQLQAEAAGLRKMSGETERLQNENERLATSLLANPNPSANSNFFDEAVQNFERIQCVNNLKQLGLAARVWAGDHNDKYPTSLVVMSNELTTTKILICPTDKARQPYSTLSFSQFQNNMSSYDFLAQPDDEEFPQCVIARCPIHNNYLLADGSVQQINPETVFLTRKDGRWYLEAAKPGATYQGKVQKAK
jgi:hypothetical protein